MAVLAKDRNTYAKTQGVFATFKVKAAVKIFAGALVGTDATGYLVPASDTAGIVIQGRANDSADNSAGASGALSVRVQQGVYLWDNSTISAVVQTAIGAVVYAEDDHTVKLAAGNGVKVGIALEITTALGGGIWVDSQPDGGL